jgi:hypothetical protein
LKAAAVLLALVSLTLFAVAADDWFSERAAVVAEPPKRGTWHGGLMLLAVTGAVWGVLWVLAREEGWSRDRVFWVGFGAFIAILTLLRPWWFWDNYKARWLRNAIGDELTALFYLAVSAVCLWVGLFTDWPFGRR